jgi:N-acetylglucosaminyl-diphospho-decaprenol L-rhamnosyltransferase
MPDSVMPASAVTVSIVSHGHGAMVWSLVDTLLALPGPPRLVVTLNTPEAVPAGVEDRVRLIRNATPKGFGANHNAAFVQCETPFFCVLNPDIELIGNPFPAMCAQLEAGRAGLCAPLILGADGAIEDSVRPFITPWRMVLRKLGIASDHVTPMMGGAPIYPDWVAGMFMLFDSQAFRQVRGFDTAYFMYCEDTDICTRLWQAGLPVVVCPAAQVIHRAQRASRRNLRHLRWHVVSMLRYMGRYWGRLPRTPRPL